MTNLDQAHRNHDQAANNLRPEICAEVSFAFEVVFHAQNEVIGRQRQGISSMPIPLFLVISEGGGSCEKGAAERGDDVKVIE